MHVSDLDEMIKSNKSEMVLKVILTKRFVVRIDASNENQKWNSIFKALLQHPSLWLYSSKLEVTIASLILCIWVLDEIFIKKDAVYMKINTYIIIIIFLYVLFVQCVSRHRAPGTGLLWACFGTYCVPKGFYVTPRLGGNFL